jgi:homoserine O-succinyltransferase
MSVALVLSSSAAKHSRCSLSCASPSPKCIERNSKTLTIGLVNNMPDGALISTEQQFISLLNSASGEFTINLVFYALPGISRGAAAQTHIDQYYRSTESLLGTELDGLIVTGKEPVTSNLADEPCWNSFEMLLEWARTETFSTVWSWLAAHAAVAFAAAESIAEI